MLSRYIDNFDYSSRFRILKGGKISLVVSALLGSAIIASAAPTGGVVTSGNATISQSGNVTNINQSTQKASINWQGFSINSNETVNFNQPNVNSITLNRVIGNERSVIDGALNANGQVWILNSNGVLFNKNAKVNTAGILATTKDISDANFQAGNYKFSGDSTASVVNMGTIEASDSGYVALLANTVSNDGTIKAYKGTVHLTGAKEATINLNGNSIVSLSVNKGVLDALVENKGAVIADGGKIYLTTNAVDEILKGVVNNSGVLEANSMDDVMGHVEVFAHGGTANIAGSIIANGGFVETSGKELSVADGTVIKAKKWLIDPDNVTIESTGGAIGTASVSASVIESALVTADVEIQATNDITVNQAINIHTVDTDEGEGVAFSSGGLTLTAGNDININDVITVGPNAYLTLNYGWNGTPWDNTNESVIYGNGGKITFGMNAEKTDFAGKVVFDIHPTTGVMGTTNGIWINEVEQTIIRDATELQAMNDDKTGKYVLANNIDLTGVTWTPIGSYRDYDDYTDDFKGSFNGLGHTILNLTLEGEFKYTDGVGGQAAGLFGNIAGEANIAGVRLLTAHVTNTADLANNNDNWTAQTAALVGAARAEQDEDYEIIGTPTIHNNIVTESMIMASGDGSNVGGIVGQAYGATISGNSVAYQTAIVSENKRRVGGIVGSAEASTIVDSYVSGTQVISGYGEVGGIAGYISDGTIVDNATVRTSIIVAQSTTEGTYGAGGIVGTSESYSENRNEIQNSSVDNSIIIAMQDVGGIIGEMEETKITNSFYDFSSTQIGDDVANWESTPTDVITYGAMYEDHYNNMWLHGNKAPLSASYLLGAADGDGYYSIDDMTDFVKMMALAYDPANKFKLSADLNLQNSGFYLPVLRGELDGNNHTISGLAVSQSYNSRIGLVGRLEGGTIKNLTLSSPNLNGYSYVGGVVGHATKSDDGTKSPTISNVTVNNFTYSYTKEFLFPSEVYDTNYDTYIDNIGAIGGDVENATLSNLNASGSITINVAANNEGHDDGTVGVADIGGLIGDMYDSTLDTANSSVTIDIDAQAKAYNSDDENADRNEVEVEQIGGLIGKGNSNSLIKNVTATGAIDIKSTVEAGTPAEELYVIEGSADIYDVGGLFGDMGESYIKNASATNTITVESNEVVNVGGLVGYTDYSFYDTATTSGALTIKDGAEYIENVGGAFGNAYGSILKDVDSTRNVTLEGSPSDGAENIGGLAGYAEETNIMSSSYTGTIDVNEVEEASNIGGLVGTNYGESGDKSFASFETTIDAGLSTEAKEAQRDVLLATYNLREDVIALKALGYEVIDDSWDDGVDGYYVNFSIETPDNTEWGVIKDSTASVNIKAQNAQNVGGLVGHMSAEDGGQIINSSVTALNGTSKVDGYSNIGGLVGKNSYGNIVDSDATINVQSNITEDEANVGGLVGYMEGDERSENTYPNYSDYANDYTWSYGTAEEANAALESVKAQFIADRLAENPGFEEDYVQAFVTNFNGTPNTIYIDLGLVKYIPIGAISNSYATGTVTANEGKNVGGLVGYISEATITGSHATGVVTGGSKVGGLVGYNVSSSIDTSHATGSVIGGTDEHGNSFVGGLVGYNEESTISDSYASGDVTGTADYTGGLVGYNNGYYSDAVITDSYATGDVSGVRLVGGLVGISFGAEADGKIINSYATGDVTGTGDYIGGLVGANENYGDGSAIIENSYATGAVSGVNLVGGLVGENAFWGDEGETGVSKVSNSYATGTVDGTSKVGGLVGEGAGSIIETSYASGKVTGETDVGGLVGIDESSTISNVYSSGEVEASGNDVGALIGQADGSTITNSYASGKITQTGTGQNNVKGLVGNVDAEVLNSFYDKTVNASMEDESTRGKTTTELKTLATYTSIEDGAWEMSGENGNYPTLGFQVEDAETIWVMAAGETPVDPTPVDPTPVDPTPVDPTPVDPTPVDPTPVDPTPVDPTPVDPTPVDPTPVDPEKEINKVITTIVNAQQVDVKLPNFVTDLNIVNNINVPSSNNNSIILNSPVQNNSFTNQLFSQLNISEGQSAILVSTPIQGLPSERISMNELGALNGNPSEVRVALGNGSIVELLNGGVNLVDGLQQEFYIQKTENTKSKGKR